MGLSLIVPMTGNGNWNEIMGMGGDGMPKVIFVYLYITA